MSPKCIPKELIEFSTISNGSTVLFTNAAFANTCLTTLAQVNAAVSSGQAIEVPVPSATFHCQVVPATVYVLAPRSEFHLDDRKGPY